MAHPSVLKPGELKSLDHERLRWFAARCALRVAPWRSQGHRALHERGMRAILEPASRSASEAAALARSLSDAGALAFNALSTADEPRARCANYASLVIAEGVLASVDAARASIVKSVITAAKYTVSVPVLLAHEGRATATVEAVIVAAWAALRQDVARIAQHPSRIETVDALVALGPLGFEGVACGDEA